ncbi:MAG: hypothetical protein AAF585_00425 [Verrucomicrobiota bacterium]
MQWSRRRIKALQTDFTKSELLVVRKTIETHLMEPVDVVNQALTDVSFGYQVKDASELAANSLHDVQHPGDRMAKSRLAFATPSAS